MQFINVIFTRVLIKMNLIEDAKAYYTLKFGGDSENVGEEEKGKKKKSDFISFSSVLNFLHAEI